MIGRWYMAGILIGNWLTNLRQNLTIFIFVLKLKSFSDLLKLRLFKLGRAQFFDEKLITDGIAKLTTVARIAPPEKIPVILT